MYKKLDYLIGGIFTFLHFLLILYSKPIVMHISHEIGTKVLFFLLEIPSLLNITKYGDFFQLMTNHLINELLKTGRMNTVRNRK